MSKRTIYHQTFYEMIPEQIEYTLYLAMESVLAISTFKNEVLFTEGDEAIALKIEPEVKTGSFFKEWDKFSRKFKQNIISEAIECGQTDGYDSGISYTYKDEVLQQIKSFWNKGGSLTVKDIEEHIIYLHNVELLDKAQFEN